MSDSSSSSASPLRLLLLGGTGYIGGSALDHLMKQHPQLAQRFIFTLVVRDQGKADQLQRLYPDAKLHIVLTSHSDLAKIGELAADSDVVMNLADADDLQLAKAINAALIKRAKAAAGASRRPVLIHTSGTSVFSDPSEEDGCHTTKHVYDDSAPDDFWALPASAPHHQVDLEVLSVQEQGVNELIVVPCTITGHSGALNPISQQIPALITAALVRRSGPQAGTIGTGANEWPWVHVADLSEAYSLLLSRAVELGLDGQPLAAGVAPLPFGRKAVFYPASGHYVHRDLAAQIAQTLHRLAPEVVKSTELKQFDQQDIDTALFGPNMGLAFGGSVRVVSSALPALGWNPQGPSNHGLQAAVEQDAQLLLTKFKEGKLHAKKSAKDK